MATFPLYRSLGAIAASVFTTLLFADSITVTDSKHSVLHFSGTKVLLLDQATLLEEKLSSHLPPDPHQAQSIVQQRLTPDLAAQITQAHQDVVTAWSLGITKIPAVVVDQKYVVYGESDIQRALDLIARHREQQEAQP